MIISMMVWLTHSPPNSGQGFPSSCNHWFLHTIPFLTSWCYFLAHCSFRKSLSMPYPIIVFSIPLPSDNKFSDLMLKSVIHFELMFVQGETLASPFLCVWVSSFPGAICWKGCLPPVCLWQLHLFLFLLWPNTWQKQLRVRREPIKAGKADS